MRNCQKYQWLIGLKAVNKNKYFIVESDGGITYFQKLTDIARFLGESFCDVFGALETGTVIGEVTIDETID